MVTVVVVLPPEGIVLEQPLEGSGGGVESYWSRKWRWVSVTRCSECVMMDNPGAVVLFGTMAVSTVGWPRKDYLDLYLKMGDWLDYSGGFWSSGCEDLGLLHQMCAPGTSCGLCDEPDSRWCGDMAFPIVDFVGVEWYLWVVWCMFFPVICWVI